MRNHAALCLLALASILALAAPPASAATITIINNDGAGEGFNDLSAPDPSWGCPDGMTSGQCRLNAFQAGADRWGELLQSNVEIRIAAQFDPLGSCSVLGQSAPGPAIRDFPGAPYAQTWYPSALADAIAGYDINPGPAEMTTTFNSRTDCTWYWWYGTDGDYPGNWATNPDVNATHFFAVVMHELAHWLGFATWTNLTNGQLLGGYPDIYTKFTYDVSLGLHWDEMTAPQRAASAVNTGNVVLDGPQDKAVADAFLTADDVTLVVNAGPAAGGYAAKGAQFGGSYLAADGLTIPMEVVNDAVGTTNDGCEPLVGFTAGNIAVIDRGICQFGLKALNAEQAGAQGAVIANNQGGTVIVLMAPGEFGRQVTIPVIAVGQDDGNVVRPTLPVSGTFDVIDVNGLHANGYPLLYTPSVLELGSSISHYDITAAPSALMEPAINLDLYNDPDMTLGMYRDEGWTIGLLFGDGFESGDTSVWSATVP